MYAALTNNKSAVSLLKSHFLYETHPEQRISTLMMALRVGHFDVAEMLMDERDVFTAKHVTPYVGAIAGGSFAFAENHFADQCDIYDKSGKSPLHQAICSHDAAAFKKLFYQASEPTQVTQWNHLCCAAYYGVSEFIIPLL